MDFVIMKQYNVALNSAICNWNNAVRMFISLYIQKTIPIYLINDCRSDILYKTNLAHEQFEEAYNLLFQLSQEFLNNKYNFRIWSEKIILIVKVIPIILFIKQMYIEALSSISEVYICCDILLANNPHKKERIYKDMNSLANYIVSILFPITSKKNNTSNIDNILNEVLFTGK